MSVKSLIYNDCCLLTNIDLNSQRIFQLLEHRFKSNSSTISFDFKLFPPEQPSPNAKISRSLLRFQPKVSSTTDLMMKVHSLMNFQKKMKKKKKKKIMKKSSQLIMMIISINLQNGNRAIFNL